MTKKFLEETKEKLKKEAIEIEKELSRFATKDTRLKGDWDTKFPEIDGDTGGEILEDRAKEIEEYERLLPVEFALENRLRNINLALKKIEEGTYGICEKCGKKIPKERLAAIPEANFCIKCQK